jgi:hypothetical protein
MPTVEFGGKTFTVDEDGLSSLSKIVLLAD